MSRPAPRLRDRIGGGRAIALIEGNSFYCSCERVFDPKLAGAPVIVLSNSDGCAIARISEAKALGIRMGEPWFKIREMCRVCLGPERMPCSLARFSPSPIRTRISSRSNLDKPSRIVTISRPRAVAVSIPASAGGLRRTTKAARQEAAPASRRIGA